MINLRLLLGLFPKTEKLEANEKALWAEYAEYQQYVDSDELKRFQELDQLIHSSDFSRKVADIKAQKYAGSEAFQKEQEYKAMKKSAQFKTYLKVKGSEALAAFLRFEESGTLQKIEELEKASSDPENAEAAKEYQKLMKSAEVKKYFAFKNAEKYKTYLAVENSEQPHHYLELEEFVHSDGFLKEKAYLLLSPSKKYLQSEEYQLYQEYTSLKKAEKIRWYFACTKTDKFKELKKLKLTFEDDFESKKLDPQKWITRYFWGEQILKDAYSLATDKHFLTDGKNLEFSESEIKILTKQEEITGKAWDPLLGFFPKDFGYTSGIINTGKSFRQKYGVFQAKVRLDQPGPVTHAFWLSGNQIVPQIDVFKTDRNKIHLSSFWGNLTEKDGIRKKTVRMPASKIMGDYVIFTLEWSPEKIVWKVNDIILATQTEAIPEEPMYLSFSSGIYKDKVNGISTSSFGIDWVKVYEKEF